MSVNRFLKELLRAFLIGNIIYVGFLVYYYLMGDFDTGFTLAIALHNYYYTMVFALLLYMLNAYWFFYLLNFFNNFIYTLKRMTIAIFGNIVLSCIGVFVSRLIILVVFKGKPFLEVLLAEEIASYRQPLLIGLGVSLVFYAIYYYKYRQENKVKEQKIIAGTAAAKFDALKNQLDPHFLFNSLNVLTSLIEEDPYQAQKFTTSLSKVYRYVLEQKNKDLVTVDEELQFAKTYVRLLKMRFEDSIVFEIPDQCSDPNAKIVPLSLQLLLENAVKHNVVTASKPLHIKVFEEAGMLAVTNNLQEKQVVKQSSGVGLTNIQQRYGILTDRKVKISKTATDFSVKLPVLTQQISKHETQEVYLEDKRYEKAKAKVKAIKGFYGNLAAYCLVIPFLIFINYRSSSFPWAIFPAVGWGFGLIANGLEAYGYNPFFGKNWEHRKMQEYMKDDDF